MIDGIQIKNVRSIVDSGMVEIRPVTLFVGRNSSGKSTFLRTLPLLKQSLAVDTKEPVLWFSRQGVDFGSYKDALSRFSSEKVIELSFLLSDLASNSYEVLMTEFGEQMLFHSGAQPLLLDDGATVRLTSKLSQRADHGGVFVSAITCEVDSDVLIVDIGADGLVVGAQFNGKPLALRSPVVAIVEKRGFFPRFAASPEERAARARARGNAFRVGLFDELSDLFHGRLSIDGKWAKCGLLKFGDKESFDRQLREVFASTSNRLAGLESNRVDRIRGHAFLNALPEVLRRAALSLRSFCKSVKYVEPVRARAARYYRYQELATDEIDADGTNVPMFLYSLDAKDRAELSRWLSEMLGFAVEANRSGDGHVELIVTERDSGQKVNLADTGFGYSQVLPVALQLWKSSRAKPKRPSRAIDHLVVAIEQPELHLHPEMQALLADLCIATAASKGRKGGLRLILETHSEHIVNRIGELVSAQRISADDVVIYVFDRESPDVPTRVRKVGYEKEGFLKSPWPHGFFVPQPLVVE